MNYYTSAQAAEQLGIKLSTLNAWAGKITNLATVNKDKVRLYTESDIAFISMVLEKAGRANPLPALNYATQLRNSREIAKPHYSVREVCDKLGYKTTVAVLDWIKAGDVHPVWGSPTTTYIFDEAGLAECVEHNNRVRSEYREKARETYLRRQWNSSEPLVKINICGFKDTLTRGAAKKLVSEIIAQL